MPELTDTITYLIRQHGPMSSQELLKLMSKHGIRAQKKEVNSILSTLNRTTLLVRDVNEAGIPTYRIRTGVFEASSGFEVKLFTELLKRKIVTRENAELGKQIRNRRNGKTYSLDIAIIKNERKYNIEVDDFGHIRPDALRSICAQVRKHKELSEIEVDWMDHEVSYADFKSFDPKTAYRWCSSHLSWCIRYHEELIKPKDITRNMWLIENGWQVMRVWNKQITEDLDKCLEEIGEWVNSI